MTQEISVSEEQTVMIEVGERVFALHLFPFRGLMYCDIMDGDEYIVCGKRVLPNAWLLPLYKMSRGGNFRFETYAPDASEYVWWEGFNDKFWLAYYAEDEIAEMEEE